MIVSGISLFCEDLREEVTGLETLVGVMGESINLAGMPPFALPRLAIYTRISIVGTDAPDEIYFNIKDPTGNVTFSQRIGKADLKQIEREQLQKDRLSIKIKVTAQNLAIPKSGPIETLIVINDKEIVTGSLIVNIIDQTPKPSVTKNVGVGRWRPRKKHQS